MVGKREREIALAEHGRWITRLRDDMRVLEQRLRGLEQRMATLELNLAGLTKLCEKLDLALAPLGDELDRLASRIDTLTGSNVRTRSKG